MNGSLDVEQLEAALLARARTLADEYMERAHRSRDRIVAEENERLRLREEREVLAAKALGERAFRRRVQQAELDLQRELDRLRWELIRGVLGELPGRLAAVAADERRYLPLLRQWLARAAEAIEGGQDLVCELNAADHTRLAEHWDVFVREAVPGRRVALDPSPRSCGGGVLVRTADDRIRVDNTFEGRFGRLEEQLVREVVKRLFATPVPMGALFNG